MKKIKIIDPETEKDLFNYDDTAYCRTHYIQMLETRLRYAKKEIDADSLARLLPSINAGVSDEVS